MKNIIVGLFLFVVASITAQSEVSVKLEKIDELKVFNGLRINLIKSDVQKLEIFGEKAGEVTFRIKKGTLRLGLKLGSSFDARKVKIDLYYNSNIDELDVNQGAVISSKDVFKQEQVMVSSQEGSYIKLDIDVNHIKIKGITGGNIQLNGTAKSQKVSLLSGASYEGFGLASGQAILYVSTGSNAEVKASELLDGKAKFGGNILYTGKPKLVTIEESLGGKVLEYKNKLKLKKIVKS